LARALFRGLSIYPMTSMRYCGFGAAMPSLRGFLVVVALLLPLGFVNAAVAADAGDCAAAASEAAPGASLLQAMSRRSPSAGSAPVYLDVEVETSMDEFAQTETGAEVAFKVGATWTAAESLCDRASLGETVTTHVNLSGWPSQMSISAKGPDAWGYSQITLHSGGLTIHVLNASEGDDRNYGAGARHWVDSDEAAPETNVYNVTEVPQDNIEAQANCTTQEDVRVEAFGYTTSPAGTQCVFGVDLRDEGYHCILDEGIYGSYGWCYTDIGASSWGSCSENCPLFGPLKKLAKKLDSVKGTLDHQGEELDELASSTTSTTTNATTSEMTIESTSATTTTSTNSTDEPSIRRHHGSSNHSSTSTPSNGTNTSGANSSRT